MTATWLGIRPSGVRAPAVTLRHACVAHAGAANSRTLVASLVAACLSGGNVFLLWSSLPRPGTLTAYNSTIEYNGAKSLVYPTAQLAAPSTATFPNIVGYDVLARGGRVVLDSTYLVGGASGGVIGYACPTTLDAGVCSTGASTTARNCRNSQLLPHGFRPCHPHMRTRQVLGSVRWLEQCHRAQHRS